LGGKDAGAKRKGIRREGAEKKELCRGMRQKYGDKKMIWLVGGQAGRFDGEGRRDHEMHKRHEKGEFDEGREVGQADPRDYRDARFIFTGWSGECEWSG
jgi:hypothetical protein